MHACVRACVCLFQSLLLIYVCLKNVYWIRASTGSAV